MGRHQLALPAKLEFLLLLATAIVFWNLFGGLANPGASAAAAVGPSQANILLEFGPWVKRGQRGKAVALQQQGRRALSRWLLQAARTSPPAFPWSLCLPNSLPVNSILS